jgi:formate hydrogenlyase subunit 6/NADH:ubiquinone oxidoreductase subunit I
MKIGTMLGDIVESFFKQPVTQTYPLNRFEPPQRHRGKLAWNPEKCTGCSLCAKDCPSNAIEMIVIDKAKKQFVLRYHVDRCTFCSQCVQNCRFKCMDMTNQEWELAALDRKLFTVYYGDETNIRSTVGSEAAGDSGSAV